IVDGIERKLGGYKWAGPVRPLRPGQRHQVLLDLTRYKPKIAADIHHMIMARVLKYESAEVTIPAKGDLDLAWDRATAALAPLRGPEVSLRGTVTGWDGKPGAGYWVSLTIPNRANFREKCDKDGHYAFVKIPPGEYAVFVPRPDRARGLTVKKVVIEAGKARTLDLSIESRFVLSGKVTYADGTPAFGQTVDACWNSPDGTMEFYDCGETDAEGRYSIGSPFEIVSWTWVMPNLDQKRKIRAADGVDFVIEHPWGQRVEGVQVRLRADKIKWKAREVPMFKAEVRNQGRRELSVIRGQVAAELEVDGQWYVQKEVSARSSRFPPGQQYKDIRFVLEKRWWRKKGDRPLQLTPGKHSVRVAFTAQPKEKDAGKPVRVISNPVEIEILAAKPPEVKPEAAPPLTPAQRIRAEL
ncbi:unnamed protein product, partial [marine sediment metagenome]